MNKTANSDFEAQRRHNQKSKIGVPVAPQIVFMSSKQVFKKDDVYILGQCSNELLIYRDDLIEAKLMFSGQIDILCMQANKVAMNHNPN